MITKDQMIDAIRSLPDDATLRDAIERLEFIEAVERGQADADAGRTISHEEAKNRFATWLS